MKVTKGELCAKYCRRMLEIFSQMMFVEDCIDIINVIMERFWSVAVERLS